MTTRSLLGFVVFLVGLRLHNTRFLLPKVPDVIHPPIPDEEFEPLAQHNITQVVNSSGQLIPIPQNFGRILMWDYFGRLRIGGNPMHPFKTRENTDVDSNYTSMMEDADPEVKPGLFQGDMAMTNEIYDYWRIGLRWDVFEDKLWNNGIVPYIISPLYEPSDHVTIYKAIRTINYMTCVKFVPWDGKTEDYLLIWPIKYPAGCWSFVGKYGGSQIVSLQPPDKTGPNCLGTEGRAMHELMHALGVFHEQSRWDRDKFVKIHMENIIPKFKQNFEKQSLENTTYSFEYDYDSIMHYGKNYFSKGKGKPTITPKLAGSKLLGQRKMMSKGDCLKLNDLYGCLDDPKRKRKYYRICQYLGL